MDGEALQKHMSSILHVPDLLQFATDFAFVERDSQLDVAGFLITLILCGGTHEGGRQYDILRAYLEQGLARVERSAFYSRFNPTLERLLAALLDRAITAGQEQPKLLPGILSGVSDWRVIDSETVKLPMGAFADYPGCGTYAAIKIHKEFSLGTGNLVAYQFSPARDHDSPFLTVDASRRGQGLLFDLAYVSLQRLADCEEHRVRVVCRLKSNWKPSVDRLVRGTLTAPLEGGEDFDLLLNEDLLLRDGKAIDADVTVGRGSLQVKMRLVGVPTDTGYCFFLTNLPRSTHGPLQVGDIYRCRWDIEIDNKVDKEGARLDEIGATKSHSIRILLMASLLNGTIARAIVQSEKVEIRRNKAPSEPADRAPLHSISLMKALAAFHPTLTRLLLSPHASRWDWARVMSRLRSLAKDGSWRTRPSVLDRIQGLTAPPTPRRSKGSTMARP